MTTLRTNEVKNQHFVPRTYLRRFTGDGSHLWALNKLTGRHFGTTIERVAQQKRFYDISVGMPGADPTWDKQTVERWLSKIEASVNKDLDALISSAETGRKIPDDIKKRLSLFITVQSARTPKFRDGLMKQYHVIRKQIMQEAHEKGFSSEQMEKICDEHGVGLEVGKQEETIRHAHLLLNEKSRELFREGLTDCVWIIGKNISDIPFLTSDDPVIQCIRGYFAVFCPLATKYILLLYNPWSLPPHMHPLIELDGICLDLDGDQIHHFNRMQMSHSQMHLFCETNFFEGQPEIFLGQTKEWTPAEENLDIPWWPISDEIKELGRQLEEGAQQIQERYG